MSVVVDASVFVSAVQTVETNHQVSTEFLARLRDSTEAAYCPALVLPESVGAVVRVNKDPDAALALGLVIESFPRLQIIPLDLALARYACDVAANHRLRGTDSVYVAVAGSSHSVLVTWDFEMLQRGGQVV